MGYAARFEAELAELELPGRVGIASWDLRENVPVLRGAEVEVHSASTIKVLVMITALRAVADGRLDLDAQVELPADRTKGTGVLFEVPSVPRASLRDLINLMIVISDNAATNAVIDQVGFAAIAECTADLGCTGTRIERHIMDTEAPGVLRTTALDQARVLTALAEGTALPPQLTAHALTVLSRQQVVDRIPLLLPENARCWNKTGEIKGLRHDVALLSTDDTPQVVLAVLVDQLTDAVSNKGYRGGDGVEAIAAIGLAAWRAMTQPSTGSHGVNGA
ncbi:serine hydrolase [Saccharopolyspora terrae]|uniref:Serine hydrolase n=1 Tax=Saccharopolyspora terrae TaxID=2530384 RepID=A0A4R4VNT9_9PSEU|nr:serine hydrolase [Saccharopolyspora terrae]TDD07352.1 serine hydrolase [Saccharopolyspora terrae]